MIKDKVKVIFVDFDWTIYDHSIDDFDRESIKALQECQKRGIEVVISTARCYHSLMTTGFFDLMKPDGMILANGTIIFHKDELIRSTKIEEDVIKRIVKEGVKHHCNFEMTGVKNRYLISKRTNYLDTIYKVFYDVKPEVHKYDGELISTMLFIGPAKYDEAIKKVLPEGMHFRRFFELGADISLLDDDKGKAILYYLDKTNMSVENSLSFGDSWLDVPMFQTTKYSCCLANGSEEAQKAAKAVGDTIMNHGVAKFLKENILQ